MLLPPREGPARVSAMLDIDRRELAAIFLGGATGALLRVWIGLTFAASAGTWPWATFAINVSGAFALGYIATRLQERLPLSTYRRPLLATGFCGTYTTFSTVQVEILRMLDRHFYGLAVGYATASILAGYLAIWIATATVRRTRVLA
jgi:fluoride exporter